MSSGSGAAPAVGVDRLQPGDHAFLAFSDDEERWDILGEFTQQGFARGEKVFLNVDAASAAEVAARVAAEAFWDLDGPVLRVARSPIPA